MKKNTLLATVGTALLVGTVGCASSQAKPDAAPASTEAAPAAPADGAAPADASKPAEGSCGAEKKAGEGSCGEGSCGAAPKS